MTALQRCGLRIRRLDPPPRFRGAPAEPSLPFHAVDPAGGARYSHPPVPRSTLLRDNRSSGSPAHPSLVPIACGRCSPVQGIALHICETEPRVVRKDLVKQNTNEARDSVFVARYHRTSLGSTLSLERVWNVTLSRAPVCNVAQSIRGVATSKPSREVPSLPDWPDSE